MKSESPLFFFKLSYKNYPFRTFKMLGNYYYSWWMKCTTVDNQ